MTQQKLDLLLDDAIAHEPAVADPIGAIKGRRRRACAPVRRNSRRAGSEGIFWRPVRRADVRLLIRYAERLEYTGRAKGQRNGPLGQIGIDLLKELGNLVRYSTGRLDPSYDYLAAKLKRSRSAVAEGLARLRAAGLLDWLRRFEPDPDKAGQRGPQIKQVSNAYRFMMPVGIGRMIGLFSKPAPLPSDEVDRQDDRRKMVERWEWEEGELYQLMLRHGASADELDARFERLWASRMEHERKSSKRSETP